MGIFCFGIGTIAGFLDPADFGKYAIVVDIFSHFRVQYLVGQLIILLPLLAFCRMKTHFFKLTTIALTGIHLGLIGLNASQILPYYIPQAKNSPVAARLRIFHLNVLGKNQQMQPTIEAIGKANADIVSLQEYNPRWRKTLEASKALKPYPYRYHVPWGDDAVYSKYPFTRITAEHIPDSKHGADVSIVAEMKLAGKPVTFLFSHPPTPIRRDLYPRQLKHFEFWAKNRNAYHDNFVIVGDLNSTPWSPAFRKLIRSTGLRDSQKGFGIQPSFPVHDWRRRIPIDHCLVSENFIVLNRKISGNVNSDHYPVIVDLALKR